MKMYLSIFLYVRVILYLLESSDCFKNNPVENSVQFSFCDIKSIKVLVKPGSHLS